MAQSGSMSGNMAIVECVPNFSEGRRPEVITAIVEAIQSAAPIRLLDVSSDTDHNRTVVTFAGTPEQVELAAFAGIQTAARLIDLDQHTGEHPRIGATDVVPFIPIADVTLAECVEIAKRLGARVAAEIGVPVYLYEAAATRPERENLENIRRGQYEGLKTAVQSDPDRKPDFGPSELPKAGATVIGARAPLIAYNVYLTTENVEIAKSIAKAMRQSTGGFRYVKAAGFLVDGKAQVSMNLTNFEKTPIYRVQEAIRREAQRYGVGIAFTELVGLIPQQALIDSARWYLQLDLFTPDQILERKLAAIPATADSDAHLIPDTRGSAFVELVAAGTPTPGGGSVAALAGGMAAALAAMVGRLTQGKKKYADVDAQMTDLIARADHLSSQLLDAVIADGEAFNAVMAANKLEGTHPKRESVIQEALIKAAEVPLQVIQACLDILELSRTAAELGNPNAGTDAAVSAHMAYAAVEAAALNVQINALSLTDKFRAEQLTVETRQAIQTAAERRDQVVQIAKTRTGLT